MTEMKRCHCCGVKQGAVDEHNLEYETLIRLIMESGDERQLLTLVDLMRAKITTCVTTSLGPHKLAYKDEDLWHVQVMLEAILSLRDKLAARQ